MTWVREGDWQDVANTTKTSMNGIQVQTISCFTNGTMHMVFDMLKKSRPVVAAQLPKQPVPVIPHLLDNVKKIAFSGRRCELNMN